MANEIIKSYRLTSKYANTNKREFIYSIFDWIKQTKNEMSEFIYYHIPEFLEQKTKFISNYRNWRHNVLPSHTIQTMFSDICKFYVIHVNQLLQNKTKKLKLKHEHRYIRKLIRYLIKVYNLKEIENYENISFNNTNLQPIWNELDSMTKKAIVEITNKISSNILKSINKMQFNNGTFRLTETGCSFEIVKDKDNSLFKYFLKLKFKKPYVIYLPLLLKNNSLNQRTGKYFKEILSGKLKKQIVLIDKRNQISSKKLFFLIAKDDKLAFSNYGKAVGIDINLTKKTFITCSNGLSVGYDENEIKEVFEFLVKIDKRGWKNLKNKERRKLKKLIGKTRWYIDYIIGEVVGYLKQQNYTDIILEDLHPFNNGKFKIELFGYKFRLNRFVRLLKLSNIKNRFIQIAHNRGIRVHLINSAYTSQQCSKCGNIDKNNRKSQSKFKCAKCNFETNADFNASRNILLRYLFKPYRKKLHIINKYGELRPKNFNFGKLKQLLISLFDAKCINKLLKNVSPVCPDVEFLSSSSPPVSFNLKT